MGRVPHHQTCPKAQGIRTVDGLARIANDGVWKSKEQEEVDPREEVRPKRRKRRRKR